MINCWLNGLFSCTAPILIRSSFSRRTYILRILSSVILGGIGMTAAGQSNSTSTTLTIASGEVPVTAVASGTVITLTVAVKAGTAPVAVGEVAFCDAAASDCIGIHRLGSAQLKAGTAVLKLRPSSGNHQYRGIFKGTPLYEGSTSVTENLSVTGPSPTITLLTKTGDTGDYNLTSTVYGTGSTAPSGPVSFIDTSNSNTVLGTTNLNAGSTGLNLLALPNTPQIGAEPRAIGIGDFDGNGIEDLALVNQGPASVSGPGTLTVLLGKGDGTFTNTSNDASVGTGPDAIAVGDFNSDGIQDVAVANSVDNNLTILLGNGDGSFTASPMSPVVGTRPASIAEADFNGDGILDLAVANTGSNNITVLLGNGDGTFTATATNQQAGSAPYFIVTADFNKDGKADLALLNNNNGQNTLTIFLGNGAGGFNLVPSGPGTGTIADALAIDDFNGDGVLDLAVVHSATTGNFPNASTTVTLSILPGNKDGTFGAGSQLNFASPNGGGADWLSVGDFNGDGRADLAISTESQNPIRIAQMVTILLGDETGTFTIPGVNASTGLGPSPVALSDLNGDGVPDIAATSHFQADGNAPAWVEVLITTEQSGTATASGIAVPPATGTAQVVATYAGDGNYLHSSSAPVTLTAAMGTPTVNVIASANPIPYGTSETLTAKVTGTGLTPTGTLTFYDGSGQLSAATLNTGTATYVTSGFTVGSHVITARYSGDTNYTSGSSSVLTLTVQKGPPNVAIALSSSNILTTQALTVGITVSGTAGNPTPEGSVVLTGGGFTSVATVLSRGTATITVPAGALSFGTNTLTAAYTPSAASAALYTTGSQSAPVTVILIGSTTSAVTITPTPNAITDQQSVSVAISVKGNGQAAPTGTVTLANGIYTAQNSLTNGVATFIVPAGTLPVGPDMLTATYSGDGVYATSSATGSLTVSQVLMAATSPPPLSAGSNATATLTLIAGSYSGSMNLTCGLISSPTNAQDPPTCVVNQPVVSISSGGNVMATVTLETTGARASLQDPFPGILWRLGRDGFTLAGLLIFGARSRRHSHRLLMILFGVVLATVMIGCGGSDSTPSGPTPQPAKTTAGIYVFKVTAADSATAKSVTSTDVTITVQ